MLFSASWARPQPASQVTDAPKIAFEKYTLGNGLQVILHIDRSLPLVHVNLRYHVGTKNEAQNHTGLAHLFEHMMYEGSKNAPAGFGTLSKIGASGNAHPFPDYTEYFETLPSGALEYILWLESDRLATLPEALNQERLDNQRAVVRNERREVVENKPYGDFGLVLFENLYPAGHPYAHDVVGTHDDLQAATLDDLKEFFHKYYAPNNLSLVIAGNFDVAETKKWIDKYFGSIPPGPAIIRPVRWITKLDADKVVEVTDRVAAERSYFAWPGPAFFQKGDAELELLASILTTRLNADLIYSDTPLAFEAECGHSSMEDGSVFMAQVTARPGVPLARLEQAVTQEIAMLAKNGPGQEELERAKNKWEAGQADQMETLYGEAELLNRYNTFLGDPDQFAADAARHRQITSEGVRDAANEWLTGRGHLLIRFHPQSAIAEAMTQVDRSVVPPIRDDPPFETPRVESGRLSNGLDVIVIEKPGAPKTSVRLITRAGLDRETAGKNGLAVLTVSTMPMGTTSHSGTEIDRGLRDLGASAVQQGVGPRQANLGFDVVKRNIEPALAIFADVVQNPAFHDYSIQTQLTQGTDELSQSQTDAAEIANQLMPRLLFGADHPYSRQVATKAGLASIEEDDPLKFYKEYWRPNGSALIFVGDISLPVAIGLATKYLGAWRGDAPAAQPPLHPNPAGTGRIYVIDWPAATQTRIAQILPGVARNDPDYYALALANEVWGAAGDSRLHKELREHKGYSYGFQSALLTYADCGGWVATGAVQADKTAESVIELIDVLKSFAGARPISEEELATAKTIEIRGYAQQFETSSSIADNAVQLWALGVPLSEFRTEPEKLRAITLASVNAVVRKYARPDKESLLLIGDLSKILPGLRKLNAGQIVVLDSDGRPVLMDKATSR